MTLCCINLLLTLTWRSQRQEPTPPVYSPHSGFDEAFGWSLVPSHSCLSHNCHTDESESKPGHAFYRLWSYDLWWDRNLHIIIISIITQVFFTRVVGWGQRPLLTLAFQPRNDAPSATAHLLWLLLVPGILCHQMCTWFSLLTVSTNS